MSSALRELIAFFGVEVDDKKLDKVDEKLEGLVGMAESVAGALGIAFGLHEVSEFIQGQIELGAQLAHTSEILGLSVGDLQAFEYAAKNAGLGAEEADTALRFLNKNLGEAATGNDAAAQAFQKLGVTVKDATGKVRPTQDVLAEVADGISKLPSPAEKTAKAMELFGRAGARMIPLLNKGSKGISEFYDEFEQLGGGIDEEFVAAAEEGEHQMNKLGLAFKGAKATIAGALLPAFTHLVEKVTSVVGWFRELSTHSYIVQTALATLGAIAAGLVVIWGILNIEIILVAVAIALLILAVDDIYTAFMGGKSVIGDFIDSLFGVGTTQAVVAALKDEAGALWGQLTDLYDAANNLALALGGTGASSAAATVSFTVMKSGLEATKLTFDAVTTAIMFTVQAVTWLVNGVTALVAKIEDLAASWKKAAGLTDLGGFSKLLGGEISHTFGAAKAAVTGAGAQYVGAAAAGAGVVQGDTHKTTNIDITVEGGDSPKETGEAVANATKRVTDNSDEQAAYAAMPGAGS